MRKFTTLTISGGSNSMWDNDKEYCYSIHNGVVSCFYDTKLWRLFLRAWLEYYTPLVWFWLWPEVRNVLKYTPR